MVISNVIKVKDWTFCEMGVIDQDITWFNLTQYALPVALEDFGYIVYILLGMINRILVERDKYLC